MSSLADVSRLEEALGLERFQALVDPSNAQKVMDFCNGLLWYDSLPTIITIGGRTYNLLNVLLGDELNLLGRKVLDRFGDEWSSLAGKDDAEHFMRYQEEIPQCFRGKVAFVFPNWNCGSRAVRACPILVCEQTSDWRKYPVGVDEPWCRHYRIPRRIYED